MFRRQAVLALFVLVVAAINLGMTSEGCNPKGPENPGRDIPLLSHVEATGDLVKDRLGVVRLYCTAIDEGVVTAVSADLRALGRQEEVELQPGSDGVSWSLLVSVRPPTAGTMSVPFIVIDDAGDESTVTATVEVLADNGLNQAPQINVPKVQPAGPLIQDQAEQVTVQCVVIDPDGTVAAVTADLSAIGGNAAEVLLGSANTWTCNCTLTPRVAGNRTVSLKATDNDGATSAVNIGVFVAPRPLPSLAGAWESQGDPLGDGTSVTLIIGEDGAAVAQIWSLPVDFGSTFEAQLLCDGQMRPVVLDAMGFGMPIMAQVSPHAYAVDAANRITFDAFTIATDYGDTLAISGDGQLVSDTRMTLNWRTDVYGMITADFVKLDPMPNLKPYFSSTTATGNLKAGEAGTLNLTCRAVDLDGTVQSVKADLSMLGGSNSVALTKGANGMWTAANVPVTPYLEEEAMVFFKAIDNDGAEGYGVAAIAVGPGGQGSLAGAWENDDGIDTIVIDDVGNAVSYFFEQDGERWEVPCDGNLHNTPHGPMSISPHTITLDTSGAITVSEYTMIDAQGTKTISAAGTLDSPRSLTLNITVDDGQLGYCYTATYTKADFPPDERPLITGLQIDGSLTYQVASTVTFTCQVTAAGSPVTQVTLDLWDLGIDEHQTMALDQSGSWTWTGEVTPEWDDYVEIHVDAVDEKGAWDHYEAEFDVTP